MAAGEAWRSRCAAVALEAAAAWLPARLAPGDVAGADEDAAPDGDGWGMEGAVARPDPLGLPPPAGFAMVAGIELPAASASTAVGGAAGLPPGFVVTPAVARSLQAAALVLAQVLMAGAPAWNKTKVA